MKSYYLFLTLGVLVGVAVFGQGAGVLADESPSTTGIIEPAPAYGALDDVGVAVAEDRSERAPCIGDCEHYRCQGADCCWNRCCEPLWSVDAGALFLTRARARSALVMDATGVGYGFLPGEPLLNASDFESNWAAGLDLSLTRRIGAYRGLEVRYFGVDGFSAERDFPTTHVWRLPTHPNIFVIGLEEADAVYRSQLYSTEINLRWPWRPRIDLLAGFRWIELREEMRVTSGFNPVALPFPAVLTFGTNVDNHLYGGQVGADVRIWDRGGPFHVDGLFKAGILGNQADSVFTFDPHGLTPLGASQVRGQVSFVGEINISGVYRVNEHVALRGGYELLWLEGIATAAGQLSSVNVLTGRGIHTAGGELYHGATTSLLFTW